MQNEIDIKALNEKIAKWLGFELKEYELVFGNHPTPKTGWYLNNEYKFDRLSLPDFVNDPKAQQTFIYPKLIECGCNFGFNYTTLEIYIAYIGRYENFEEDIYEVKSKDNPTFAFALACGKLVDELEKKNASK